MSGQGKNLSGKEIWMQIFNLRIKKLSKKVLSNDINYKRVVEMQLFFY